MIDRIHLERWPSYVAKLNPAEGIWKLLKWSAVKNICCSDVSQSVDEPRLAKE
jgi:transposase